MPTLEWIGKDKVVNHHQQVPYKTLVPKYTYNAEQSDNMIIKGDNLEALKALLPRFEGKVKCIYIDPPYNTGNEGWVYNDNVNDPKIKKWLGEVVGKEGEDLSRHDKWLCMMYPRLKLLQKLLAVDGAIFISIDATELASLKMVCDEIFGQRNFVDYISWFKKASPSNDAHYFSNDIEYIVVYARNKEIWKPRRLPLTDKQLQYYRNPDNDPRGPWNSATYTCNKTKDQRPSLYYPITNPNTQEEVWPSETAVWAYSKEQCEEHIKHNLLFWGNDGKARTPRFKKFLSGHQGVVNRTLWHYDDVNHTQGASMELKDLNIQGFDTPKPSRLIERILRIATDPNDTILDSFAGSGTTAHAVLKMGEHRKFILVEMMDYADSITAERVKRVIDGYGEGRKAVEGTGGDFTFYELGIPLLTADGNINEEVDLKDLREYIWYMETHEPLQAASVLDPYYLGTNDNTAYYFCYERNAVTTLDMDLLATVTVQAESYVFYADQCGLSDEELKRFGITFRKIPRDIAKL